MDDVKKEETSQERTEEEEREWAVQVILTGPPNL